MAARIEINCDLGEGVFADRPAMELKIMAAIDAANIACGAHAGSPAEMARTVELAVDNGVLLGAHPGYRDRDNFGRKSVPLSRQELLAELRFQVGGLKTIAESLGGRLSFVKPHGALYHDVCLQREIAEWFLDAMESIGGPMAVVGLPEVPLQEICRRRGLKYRREAFADRAYLANGQLVDRKVENAVLHDPAEIVRRIEMISGREPIPTIDGGMLRVEADTICLHGDHPAIEQTLELLEQSQG